MAGHALQLPPPAPTPGPWKPAWQVQFACPVWPSVSEPGGHGKAVADEAPKPPGQYDPDGHGTPAAVALPAGQ